MVKIELSIPNFRCFTSFVHKDREQVIDQLEIELRDYSSRINLLALSREQGTYQLTRFIRTWANAIDLSCEREVHLGATRLLRKSGYPYKGYLDFVIGRWLAIEIDSANKHWSLKKLEDAAQRGFVPVWIRWCAPQKLSVPPTVRLILLPTR